MTKNKNITKVCDLVQMYTPVSTGIRTYIEKKRCYIRNHTHLHHVLIVPGEKDTCISDGRLTVYHIAAPLIPKCEP